VATLVTFTLHVVLLGWPAPVSLEGLRAFGERFVALVGSDGRNLSDELQIIGLIPSNNVLPMFAFAAVAALAHRSRFGNLVTAARRFRWRMMLAGFVLFTIVVGPFVAIAQLTDPKALPAPVISVSPDGLQRLAYVLVCFVVFVPAALGEEILFRGWLLRQTGAVIRQPLVLMAINGVLFSAAHMQFEPDAFLERWLMGAGFAYMTLRLGGVEMSAGAHAANNLMILLFIEPLTLKAPPNAPMDAGATVAYLGLFVAFIGMAELAARWPPLRSWTGATVRPAPATSEAEHFS
jgi:membrane protease YdiL (CAAX protease family)